MDSPQLQTHTRTIAGKQVKQIRKAGQLPGVVYGNETKNVNIAFELKDYERTYNQAGTSSLVDLVIDDQKPIKVLLHDPQLHPLKLNPIHADFYVVKMNEKLQTEIPIEFVGETEAVTSLDGTLSPQLDTLTVECFPDKLVPVIEVDITGLKTLDDILRVSDITIPQGIEVLDDPETVVLTITPPRTEEELAELEEVLTGADADAAAVGAVEVTTEKKDEEDEPKE